MFKCDWCGKAVNKLKVRNINKVAVYLCEECYSKTEIKEVETVAYS